VDDDPDGLDTVQDLFETRDGKVVGTPSFLSPERWEGRDSDGAADVWALGVILHELVAGRRPFPTGSPAALRDAICSPDPVARVESLEERWEPLADIIAQCLAKDPQARLSADELVAKLRQMLRGDQHHTGEERAPFRGLLPFGEQHADFFYGREAEISAFVERLREEPVLPVVGPAGAGKSSFVGAGVLPRLKEQGAWLTLQLRPGGDPFASLASRIEAVEGREELASEVPTIDSRPQTGKGGGTLTREERDETLSGQHARVTREQLPSLLNLELLNLAEKLQCRVLLFVDQLEELYTLVEDERTRRHFMWALCSAADDRLGPVRVIFTLREDFLGRLAEGEMVREALSHLTVIRPPDADALAEILTKPVQAAGYRFDDPLLVSEMVESTRNEAACLPLLQFTARALWDRRDTSKHQLRRETYDAMGGVAGALAARADSVLHGMSEQQHRLTRDLLLRLVTSEGTRRVLFRAQLLDGLRAEAEAVLDQLVRARLLSVRKARGAGAGEVEVELVHESLINTWTRLSRWVEESREDLVFLAELDQAVELWERRGRPQEEVWQKEALHDGLRRAARCANVPERALRFLEAGRRREQRRVRARRLLVAGIVAVLAVVAILFAAKEREAQRQKREAVSQRWRAVAQRQVAESQRRLALRQRSAAQREGARAAMMRGELVEARAKLRASLEIRDSPLARALWWRLQQTPVIWRKSIGTLALDMAFSPDGRWVAAAAQARVVYLFETETQQVRILRGYPDQVFCVAFSPDGRTIAAGGWNGQILIRDLRTDQVTRLKGHTAGVLSVSFSADGAQLVSASYDKTIRLWEVSSQRTVRVLRGHTDAVSNAHFSKDGKRLFSASYDRTIRLWPLAGGAPKVLRGHKARIRDLSLSGDGRWLVSGSDDRTVRIWNVSGSGRVRVLRGHRAQVKKVRVSPDGSRIASASYDRTIRIWASSSIDQTVRLWRLSGPRKAAAGQAHSGATLGASFSADGRLLATGSEDKTIRIWDVASGRGVAVLTAHEAPVNIVLFSPDGRTLASGSDDKTIRIWDVARKQVKRVLRGHREQVWGLSFHPKGRLLASGSSDRTVKLWNVATGRTLRTLTGHLGPVQGVAFSPDGAQLASASYDKTVRMWNPTTGLGRVLGRHGGSVWGLAFSPDGAQLATGSSDKTVRLWNTRTGVGRTIGTHGGRAYRLAYHPKRPLVGVPSAEGFARLWNLKTGRFVALRGHRSEVNLLRFRRDGRLAVTTSDDGTVRLWDVPTGRPAWRAPLLRDRPVSLLTHRGWVDAQGKVVPPSGKPAWQRAARESSLRGALTPDGRLACLSTFDDHLEIWDTRSDRRLVRQPLTRTLELVATDRRCVTLAASTVRTHDAKGASRIIASGASAIALDSGQLLVAARRKVTSYRPGGTSRASYPTDLGATAVCRAGAWIVVGFADGNLELVPTTTGRSRARFAFEDVPSSPVVRLVAGPRGTVVAGFANGTIGLWSLRNGARLHHARLHGPVSHLHLRGKRLFAGSELGQLLVWDLDVFYGDYCHVLRQVWSGVPVIWEAGLPVRRSRPSNHRCAGPP